METQRGHAALSPSSAHRWLMCTASVRAVQKNGTGVGAHTDPDASRFAHEGTIAHKWADIQLKAYTGQISRDDAHRQTTQLERDNPATITPLMVHHLNQYVKIITSEIEHARSHAEMRGGGFFVLLEQRVDYSDYVPGGYGTADVVIIAGNTAEVIDLKYGAGLPVPAANNPQTRLYALGVLQGLKGHRRIDRVITRIVQPRTGANTTETITAAELIDWAETTVRPKAQEAVHTDGRFVPGEHCRFCPIAATCRAKAEQENRNTRSGVQRLLEIAANMETLTPEAIAEVLDLNESGAFTDWIQSVKDTAESHIENGGTIPGWTMGPGRGRRQYHSDTHVLEALTEYDIDKIAPRKPLGVVQMEQLLGPDVFREKLGPVITRKQGKRGLIRAEI